MELLKSKSIHILIYALECFTLPKSDLKSLDIAVTRFLMKLFRSFDMGLIAECQRYFGSKLSSELMEKRKLNLHIIIRPRRSRSAVAYSHQTFLSMICRSVLTYVRRSAGRFVCPVHCGKTADPIRMLFGIVGRTGPGMRQVVRFEDRSAGRGTFGANLGRTIVTTGGFTEYVCNSAATRPLPKLLCANLFMKRSCCNQSRRAARHVMTVLPPTAPDNNINNGVYDSWLTAALT